MWDFSSSLLFYSSSPPTSYNAFLNTKYWIWSRWQPMLRFSFTYPAALIQASELTNWYVSTIKILFCWSSSSSQSLSLWLPQSWSSSSSSSQSQSFHVPGRTDTGIQVDQLVCINHQNLQQHHQHHSDHHHHYRQHNHRDHHHHHHAPLFFHIPSRTDAGIQVDQLV